MPAEVESMFYVGKKPWHGLGEEVPANIGIVEGIVKAGLDWVVEKQPMFVLDENLVYKEVPGYYATVRKSDDSILGVVKGRYQVYQNIDAFKWFEPYLESKLVQLHTAGSLQNGKRVWILAKVNGIFTVARNDDVELYLLLSHSHDGSLQIDVGTTPIRVVCANTLRLAHQDRASKLFRIKHTRKDIVASVESLRHNIDMLIHDFEGTVEQYQYLASRPCNSQALQTYLENVFEIEDVEKTSARTMNQVRRVEELFSTGMGNNLSAVAGTAWAAYNATTQWLSYERGNTPDSRINSLWFGESAKMNEHALSCALQI